MNLEDAIDKAISSNDLVTFECATSNADLAKTVGTWKGCALIKPSEFSTEVTVWPPSKCTTYFDGDKMATEPTVLLPPHMIDAAAARKRNDAP